MNTNELLTSRTTFINQLANQDSSAAGFDQLVNDVFLAVYQDLEPSDQQAERQVLLTLLTDWIQNYPENDPTRDQYLSIYYALL